MAEADLKKAIQERIQREKEAILNRARSEADKIFSQAKDEASILHQSYLSEIKKNCLFKKTKELNFLHQEAKRQLLEAKEKRISEVFSKVKENFKNLLQQKERYESIFRSLLVEAQENFPKETKLKLKINSRDEFITLKVAKELKLEVQIENQDSIDGGLEISDLDENMSILNTFESRLNKLRPELREAMSKILFGE